MDHGRSPLAPRGSPLCKGLAKHFLDLFRDAGGANGVAIQRKTRLASECEAVDDPGEACTVHVIRTINRPITHHLGFTLR